MSTTEARRECYSLAFTLLGLQGRDYLSDLVFIHLLDLSDGVLDGLRRILAINLSAVDDITKPLTSDVRYQRQEGDQRSMMWRNDAN